LAIIERRSFRLRSVREESTGEGVMVAGEASFGVSLGGFEAAREGRDIAGILVVNS
jgi:hypothetical protein